MSLSHVAILCLAVCLGAALTLHGADGTEVQLYRATLAGDHNLVVTKSRYVPASALDRALPSPAEARPVSLPEGFCSLTFDLGMGEQPPLRLQSWVFSLYKPAEYEELKVLDVLPLKGRWIVAMAYPLSQIHVFDVRLVGGTRMINLRPSEWGMLPAAIPAPPGRLKVKLACDATAERIEVSVTDTILGQRRHTLFHQKGQEWDFQPVKQWEEKVNPNESK